MSAYKEGFAASADGLQLYYRDYDGAGAGGLPVLCLAGLTRNTRDFEDVAAHMAATRRVIAMDTRGRGRSAYDPKWENYSIPMEVGDVLAVLAALNIPKVIVLGTSRGGLIATVLAAMKPDVLGGVILNDVGPEIDPRGIARIASYVGVVTAPPQTWDDAMARAKQINGDMFDMPDSDWMRMTRATYREDGGKPVLDYDMKIGDATRAQMAQPQAFDPWALFAAYANIPLLVVRGANSDLLSAETVTKMQTVKPDMKSVDVPGRGHAPLLNEPVALAAIDSFLADLA
jgi:pimeloyl-ACP methyl ester carboxylesterase